MPLYLFYTMVQKSQKWPKTQIKGGGGSCLKTNTWKLNAVKVLRISAGLNHTALSQLAYQCEPEIFPYNKLPVIV